MAYLLQDTPSSDDPGEYDISVDPGDADLVHIIAWTDREQRMTLTRHQVGELARCIEVRLTEIERGWRPETAEAV